MPGDEVCQVFEALLPQAAIDRLCPPCGVSERQGKLPLGMLVRAMVMSAGPPGGAYQADVVRAYLKCAVPQVTRAAFSRGFDAPLEPCRAALAERALAQAQQVELPGPLRGVQDWSMVDSTTVTVREALRADVPGTGASSALKGHTVLSVGCEAPVRDRVSPARAHDRRPLTIDAAGRGWGLLADLGYTSMTRLRACEAHDVRVVLRLKDNWQPKVDSLARGQVTGEFLPGTALDALLEDDTRVLAGRVLDADGHVSGDKHPLHLRLVGVQPLKGSGFFLTNLPQRLGPRQVADLYRGRWEVERNIRLDTSVHRLAAIDAEPPGSLKTRRHASRMASTRVALLAHTHPPQDPAAAGRSALDGGATP